MLPCRNSHGLTRWVAAGARPSLRRRPAWPPIHSPCSINGSPRRAGVSRTIPRRWRWRRRTLMAGRSVRMVLLKGHGPDGFIFYTNDDSAKGEELAANPRAALLFHWKSLRRQVRIEGGRRARVRRRQANDYFASRGRGFAARRLGFGSVAAARQPRDVRAALRKDEGDGSKVRTCRARRTGAVIGSSRSGSNIGATGRTGCTNADYLSATATGGPKGCSTHDDSQGRGREFR